MNKFYNICWQDFRFKATLFEHFAQTSEYLSSTLEHLILFGLIYILGCILMYILVTIGKFPVLNPLKGAQKVLFVISHPDDEVMFFGPTIYNLIRKTQIEVFLMCLSTGSNYGMGTTRKQELYKSLEVLGVKEENIIITTHTDMPDKIDIYWPSDIIEKMVLRQVEKYDIDVLITFDRHGVSGHPNHCSVYFAVANLIIQRKLPKSCSVYVLETVDVLRKYWLILDLPLTLLLSRVRYILTFGERRNIHRAMRQHKSQLVWFRYLYMVFSRYMLINSLQKMNMADVELDLEIDD